MRHEYRNRAKRVIQDLRELAALTSDANGAHRVAWTPVWDKALTWFQEKMQQEGASLSVDSAYNIFAKISGETEEAVCIGSHLDSVPCGGWLDGALGVAAGMEVLRYYGNCGKRPKKTIYIVNWADEEGARFGRSCIGSSAVSGALDIESAAQLTDSGGISFRKAAQAYQLDVYDFPKAKEEFQAKQIAKYLELHIEQAPILESRHKAAACVYGITGCKRQYITFTGQQAHSGCPIPMRRDALLAAAQAALAFRYIGNAYTQGDTYAYCTVGSVQVSPGVVTIFPGTCRISLDQRHIDRGILEEIYNEAQEACIEAAQENHVDVSFETIWDIPPTIFDASLVALCKEAVKEETGEATAIYSGPLHDAAEIAKILPSVMMFVRSIEGLSHCKEENTSDIDLEIGIAAFLRLADKVIRGETVC